MKDAKSNRKYKDLFTRADLLVWLVGSGQQLVDNTFATLHFNVASHGTFILSEPKFTEFKNVQNKAEDEFAYKIIGCAMKVHNTLGNGFQEVIYQRSLAIELCKAGLEF